MLQKSSIDASENFDPNSLRIRLSTLAVERHPKVNLLQATVNIVDPCQSEKTTPHHWSHRSKPDALTKQNSKNGSPKIGFHKSVGLKPRFPLFVTGFRPELAALRGASSLEFVGPDNSTHDPKSVQLSCDLGMTSTSGSNGGQTSQKATPNDQSTSWISFRFAASKAFRTAPVGSDEELWVWAMVSKISASACLKP